MALDLKLSIYTTDDCKNLVIEDVTRTYNPETNPGGWGDFNIGGSREGYDLQIHLTVHHFIGEEQYNTSITVPNFANSVVYPSEDTFQGFKISIPASDISSEMSLLDNMPEDFDPMWETLEDTLYKVTVQISGGYDYSKQFDFKFTNVCTTKKAVDKFLGSVNLGCEDCDDQDLEKALLAKSLFDNLKKLV